MFKLNFKVHLFYLFVSINLNAQLENANDLSKKRSITFGTGVFLSENKVVDAGDKLKNYFFSDYSVRLGYQQTLKNHFFWETNFLYNRYKNGYWLNYPNPILGASSPSFIALENNFGLGYSLNIKNYKNIMDFHVGLNVGYAFGNKGHIGNMGFYQTPNADYPERIHSFHARIVKKSDILLGSYLGFSKEFRLSDYISLGLHIQYQKGFKKIIEIDVEYLTLESPTIQNAQIFIEGTDIQAILYCKIKFNAHNNKLAQAANVHTW